MEETKQDTKTIDRLLSFLFHVRFYRVAVSLYNFDDGQIMGASFGDFSC